MTRSFVLATALFLCAAVPLSFAQTTTPATPPVATAPAVPAVAPTPVTPGTTTTTSTTTSTTTTVPDAPATGACHTRKAVGAACSCIKAPTTMGTSTASPTGGRNMCVVS